MKTISTYLILVFSSLHCHSQIDSILNLQADSLQAWLDRYVKTDNEYFPEVSHHAISRELRDENYEALANLHSDLSFWNYINYQENGFDTISFHRIKQIYYDSLVGSADKMGKGYVDLAIDYLNDNQLKKGQDALFRSIDIFESLDDQVGLAEALANLAYVYVDMNEPEKALYFAKQSLPIFKKEKIYFMVADLTLLGFCKTYLMMEDYENAMKYVDISIAACTENDFEMSEMILVEAYLTKGKMYKDQEKPEEANKFFEKAWDLDIQFSGSEVAERIRFDIGDALLAQGRYQEALPHLLAGSKAREKLADADPELYILVSECYQKLGQYQEALNYRIQSIELQKRITDNSIASLQSEALVKYETGRKDQELLEKEETIQQKNRIQWLSLGAAALFAIVLATLFFFFRKNKKTSALLRSQNKIIEERNQQNEVLLKEIHHRVKNNLQVISSLLNFQSREIDDQLVKTALLDSQSRVQSMSLIHQKLYRGKNLASVEMKSYLENLSESLIDAYSDEDLVDVKLDMQPLELDVDFAIPLGLIANELMTNSLKYAFPKDRKGTIQIRLERDGSDLILHINDDGIGQGEAKEERESSGFGSELIEMLTLQLKGNLVQSSEGGFSTKFRFPHERAA